MLLPTVLPLALALALLPPFARTAPAEPAVARAAAGGRQPVAYPGERLELDEPVVFGRLGALVDKRQATNVTSSGELLCLSLLRAGRPCCCCDGACMRALSGSPFAEAITGFPRARRQRRKERRAGAGGSGQQKASHPDSRFSPSAGDFIYDSARVDLSLHASSTLGCSWPGAASSARTDFLSLLARRPVRLVGHLALPQSSPRPSLPPRFPASPLPPPQH